MKKFLALALALIMAVCVMSVSVFADELVVFDKPEGDNLGGVDSWCGVGYTDGYGNLGEPRAYLEGVLDLDQIKTLFTMGGTKFEYTFGASVIDYASKGGPSANINFGIEVYTPVTITELGGGMYKGEVELDELLAAWEAAGYTVDGPEFVGFVIQIWCGDFVLYNAKFITDGPIPEAPAVEEEPAVEEPAVEDTPVAEEPAEEEPAETGLALAVVPMIVAMAAVALTKKR